MYTSEPLRRYWPQISARRAQATMLCHSVLSCFSPLLSVNFSSVAMVNLATVVPLGMDLTSGSLPKRPTRMTLLIICSPSSFHEMKRGERGRRASFDNAEEPERARALFELFASELAATGIRVATGRFREMMIVAIENDGPVTFVYEG